MADNKKDIEYLDNTEEDTYHDYYDCYYDEKEFYGLCEPDVDLYKSDVDLYKSDDSDQGYYDDEDEDDDAENNETVDDEEANRLLCQMKRLTVGKEYRRFGYFYCRPCNRSWQNPHVYLQYKGKEEGKDVFKVSFQLRQRPSSILFVQVLSDDNSFVN